MFTISYTMFTAFVEKQTTTKNDNNDTSSIFK